MKTYEKAIPWDYIKDSQKGYQLYRLLCAHQGHNYTNYSPHYAPIGSYDVTRSLFIDSHRSKNV